MNDARLLRHFAALTQFGATPEGGISRVAYSEADIDARAHMRAWMREAGLGAGVDPAGNLIGRREGSAPGLPPLMLGSHLDSVPDGGNYDGQVGSLAAVEVLHSLADANLMTRHPLEVVLFHNEEGGKTGSRLLSGEVMDREWALPTRSGRTIGEGTRLLGGDPADAAAARREPGSVAAFLELHIEQGATLDRSGIDIGVVEGIVGIRRWTVTVDGFANHAGTTPMDQRQDALLAAAKLVDLVNRVITATPGSQVGTVGKIEASPGAANVIPGQAVLSLEIRDLDLDKIDRLFEQIRAQAGEIERATGTRFSWENIYLSRPALTDPRIQGVIDRAAGELGLSTRSMPSGAGHDAQSIARFAPIGMIFVPSKDGISHSPREFTEPEDVVKGANVLLRTLLKLDEMDWTGG